MTQSNGKAAARGAPWCIQRCSLAESATRLTLAALGGSCLLACDPSCVSVRDDNAPPTYAWSYATTPIGSTTLRYFADTSPGALGLVVLFDGGFGGEAWFAQMESRIQTEALVAAGYSVAALESEDPNDGNFDGTPPDDGTNLDVQNLQLAIDHMQSLGVPTSPLYYLGFSSGGAFASMATRFVPASALALFNATVPASVTAKGPDTG